MADQFQPNDLVVYWPERRYATVKGLSSYKGTSTLQVYWHDIKSHGAAHTSSFKLVRRFDGQSGVVRLLENKPEPAKDDTIVI